MKLSESDQQESETFYVEEGFYNNVLEGEEVELHKTLISKLHLTLTKSNLSQRAQ